MKTHVAGKAAVAAAAPLSPAQAQRLADLRFMVLDTVTYSPYATADEKARTAQSVARCQSEAVLLKWYANVLTVLSERELAPPTVPVAYATAEQKQAIICLLNHPNVSKARKTKELLNLNRLTDTQAVALIAELTALTTEPTPTRPRRKARAKVPAVLPVASFAVDALQATRSRSHNGSFVCPTYSLLPALEAACLDKLLMEQLTNGQRVECHSYTGPLARPCKASARVLTVFVN